MTDRQLMEFAARFTTPEHAEHEAALLRNNYQGTTNRELDELMDLLSVLHTRSQFLRGLTPNKTMWADAPR